MNERQQFEEWYQDNVNKHADFYKPQYSDNYHKKHIQDCWYSWQASALREGYNLVPVGTLQEALGWAKIAEWDSPNKETDKEIRKHKSVIEKVMMGAYSADKE